MRPDRRTQIGTVAPVLSRVGCGGSLEIAGPTQPDVREPCVPRLCLVQDIAPVEYNLVFQTLSQFFKIRALVGIPLGQDHQRVGAVYAIVFVAEMVNAIPEMLLGALQCL